MITNYIILLILNIYSVFLSHVAIIIIVCLSSLNIIILGPILSKETFFVENKFFKFLHYCDDFFQYHFVKENYNGKSDLIIGGKQFNNK